MISIKNDSLFNINSSIPSLPFRCDELGGSKLPNGDLLVCGGWLPGQIPCFEYLYYFAEFNQWINGGNMRRAKRGYSSVFIDGRMFSTGGNSSLFNEDYRTTHHEEFSVETGVKVRKEIPIALTCHTATAFGEHQMLIAGGSGERVSIIYKYIKRDTDLEIF